MLEAYAAVPYRGHAFPQTHPDHLALLATLHGLEPVDPDACRVLELGCGDGMNVVAMAAASGRLQAVGLDVVAAPLERGRAVAAALGLRNLELRAADVRAPGPLGTFDYVVVHGVWSWVSADVREALLGLVGEVLAPHGVAFVSYVALPGGRLHALGRDVARLGARGASTPGERVVAARRLLAALEPWTRERSDPYGQALGQQLRRTLAREDFVVAHDELAGEWAPVWLSEMAEAATRRGLRYLCDADLAELRADWLPPGADALLDELAGDDPVTRGELADALSGRGFRQSLLCRAERAGQARSTAGLGRLRVGDARVPFAQWANARADPAAEALAGLRAGTLALHVAPARYATAPSERPEAFPLARVQAEEGPDVTNLRHEHLRLEDPYSRLLVAALDGTRDRAQLVTHLSVELERARITPQWGLALRRRVEQGLDGSLATLAALALLRH